MLTKQRFINGCVVFLSSRSFTSTVNSLVHGRSSTASDPRQPLASLPQERVLDAWRHKSHGAVINSNLSPLQLEKKKKGNTHHQNQNHVYNQPGKSALASTSHVHNLTRSSATVVSLFTRRLRAGARSNIKQVCAH